MSKESFQIKGRYSSQRNCQNQLSHISLSHIDQECKESLIQGKIHSYSTEFEHRPQVFIKLSFRELCDSKLSSLPPFDNMAIIH